MGKSLALRTICPSCGHTGRWAFHCDHGECVWLRCSCKTATFDAFAKTFIVKRSRR